MDNRGLYEYLNKLDEQDHEEKLNCPECKWEGYKDYLMGGGCPECGRHEEEF